MFQVLNNSNITLTTTRIVHVWVKRVNVWPFNPECDSGLNKIWGNSVCSSRILIIFEILREEALALDIPSLIKIASEYFIHVNLYRPMRVCNKHWRICLIPHMWCYGR